MKREFTNENFEDFLKRSADSLRMKAPDKVWQNLSKELNKRRRRWIFGLGAFLLATSTAGYFAITATAPSNEIAGKESITKQTKTASSIPTTVTKNLKAPLQTPHQATTAFTDEGTSAVQKQRAAVNNRTASYLTGALNRNQQGGNTTATGNIPGSQIAATSSSAETNFVPTVVDSYTEFDDVKKSETKEVSGLNLNTASTLPLTIESVINSYKLRTKKGKVETQLYFTPTISYRKLTENKSYLRTLDPAAIPSNLTALNSSVNSNVTHKPDLGFEVGFTTKIPLSSKLKIRSGLQFNVNRYDIRAFNSSMSVATIALNTGNGIDSLNRATAYSNVSGYKSNWLQNLSFQISAPVGVEYSFSKNDKVEFGMAATVQPTYVLGDRAYLISTDYKSYTQVPWLTRRWNVNTALETFVKYKNWQFGPQVRYQLLSSFISEYPVKENLFDFGLKVGVTLK